MLSEEPATWARIALWKRLEPLAEMLGDWLPIERNGDDRGEITLPEELAVSGFSPSEWTESRLWCEIDDMTLVTGSSSF